MLLMTLTVTHCASPRGSPAMAPLDQRIGFASLMKRDGAKRSKVGELNNSFRETEDIYDFCSKDYISAGQAILQAT